MNVPVIVAPYEADAQITFLVNSGAVDFAITEDSDLLPFGCQVTRSISFTGLIFWRVLRNFSHVDFYVWDLRLGILNILYRQKVLFKMDEQGHGIEIDLADLGKTTDEPRFDGWTIDKFR